jgi:hypothetical protein
MDKTRRRPSPMASIVHLLCDQRRDPRAVTLHMGSLLLSSKVGT